jgi:hypothetical protein
MGLPGCSSGSPGAEVDGAWDDSWRRHHFAQIYVTAKPSHVGVDVDRLACPLHHPAVCGHQTRGQSFLSGTVLSHCTTVDDGAFPGGGGEALGSGY